MINTPKRVPPVTIKERCRAHFIKGSGCCYRGKFIGEGKSLQISACESCTCTRGKSICQIMDCAKPPEGCSITQTATECCKLTCTGCNYNGIFIPEGETKTVAPCTYGTCSGGEVMIAMADCGPLQPGCRYESTMDECCKQICTECNHFGIIIREGETETIEPCEYGTCTNGVITSVIERCGAEVAGCRYESSMLKCCDLVCDGCDYNGIHIPEGETQTVEPCIIVMVVK